MPYVRNRELPAPIRESLPPAAQDVFRKAFNHAFGKCRGNTMAALRAAWAAVEQEYEEVHGHWRPKASG